MPPLPLLALLLTMTPSDLMGQVIHMSSREIIIFNDSFTPGLSFSLFQNSFFQVNLHISIGSFGVAQYIGTKQAKSNTLAEISSSLNITG